MCIYAYVCHVCIIVCMVFRGVERVGVVSVCMVWNGTEKRMHERAGTGLYNEPPSVQSCSKQIEKRQAL